MKLFDIFWKEVSLIKTQRIALLLILLYPLLTSALLLFAFSGFDVAKLGAIKVGVNSELSGDNNFISQIGSDSRIKIIDYSDFNSMLNSIKKKEIVLGLKVTQESSGRIIVGMFYDNSNLLSSQIFMSLAKAIVQTVTVSTTQEKLSKIWEPMSSMAANIDSEIARVNQFKLDLNSAEKSLDQLEIDLNELDFSEIRSILSEQESNVDYYKSTNNAFDSEMSDFESSFEDLKGELDAFKLRITTYRADLNDLSSQIVITQGVLDEVITNLSVLSDLPVDDAAVVQGELAKLVALRNKLSSWNLTIVEIESYFDEIEDDDSELNQTIAEADSLFAELETESNDISDLLSTSGSDINSVSEKLNVFEDSLSEVTALIADSRKSKVEITDKLNKSSSALVVFAKEIKGFFDIDSSILAQPVRFGVNPIFSSNSSGIMVSNATIIVLILTCLLLTSLTTIIEKNQNVHLRVALSPTSRFTLILGKILGQLFISLVEAAIIFIVAIFGFGLVLNCSIFELAIAIILISLSFISLGLLISFFTNNQSTAILSSLLVMVPMIFLSGIIMPLEFMDPLMQLLSSFLPLTIANQVLLGLVVKGLALSEFAFELSFLMLIFFIISAIVLSRRV